MALSARQKRTLQQIAEKLATRRKALEEDEHKVLSMLEAFDHVRTSVDEGLRKEVTGSRARLRERFADGRERVAEAAKEYNQAAETFTEEDIPVGIDDWEIERLEEPLEEGDFDSLLVDWSDPDTIGRQSLLEFDADEMRKALVAGVRGMREGLDEALRDARKDPDDYLENIDDPEHLLGEEDYGAWQSALEEEG